MTSVNRRNRIEYTVRDRTNASIRMILEAGKSMEDSYRKQKEIVKEFFIFSDDFSSVGDLSGSRTVDLSRECYLDLLERFLATTEEMTLKYETMRLVIKDMIDFIREESEEAKLGQTDRPSN